MEAHATAEQHVEVHKFYAGVVTATVLLALLLEAFLRANFRWADLIELPLLVTIYFALSRRNPSGGLMLGMVIGLVQDSLSHTPIGFYGIAKTLVGFVASSLGARLDVEHPVSRFILTLFFFYFHNSVLVMISRVLLAHQQPYFTPRLLIASRSERRARQPAVSHARSPPQKRVNRSMRHRTLASARVFIIAAAALVLIESAAPRAQTQGDGGLTVTYSASDTSIVATWTTATSADTKCFAGEKPGLDNNAPEPNKTSHICIVTGLAANTSFSVYAESGDMRSTPQMVTTDAAQVRTPVNQVALGSTITAGPQEGDYTYTFVSNDGNQYITQDDGFGFEASPNGGANMQIGKLTTPSTLMGTLVNRLTNYGGFASFNGTDGPGGIPQTNKLTGIFGMGGCLYLFHLRASNVSTLNPNLLFGNIMLSKDHGMTWNSWQTPSVFNANGVPPSPLGSYQYPSRNVGKVTPIRYAADDGTIGYLTKGNRIDGADGWIYMFFEPNGNIPTLYLMRAPRIEVELQSTTGFQFWAGPSPASVTPAAFVNDANWSSSFASAVSVAPAAAVYDKQIEFIPGMNRYMLISTTQTGNSILWLIHDGVTPAGPWTLVAQQSSAPQDWYSASVMHSTEIGNSALSNVHTTLLYSGIAGTPLYGPHSSSMILNPNSSPNMQQLISYACTTIENPVSDRGNFSTVTGSPANIQAVSGNACEPAATSQAALAVYTAPPVSGDTGAPWPNDQCADAYMLSASATGYFGPGVRMTTAGTGYVGVAGPQGNGYTQIYKLVSAGLSAVGSSAPAVVSNNDIWRLCAVGTTINWYQNAGGVAGGFTLKLSVIDSSYASGSPGWVQAGTGAVTDSRLGLFDGLANQASSPTFSPSTSGYSGTVTITSATTGARIYYTTDGTQPTRNSSSMANGGAVSVTSPATVKAIAAYTNLADSPVSTVSY